MVVLYLGTTGCADSDFPLIRALQQKGVEVYSYFFVNKYIAKSGLFNIQLYHTNSIISAKRYDGLKVYENYLDLSKMFVINCFYYSRRMWQYWFYGPIWWKVLLHMRKHNAQVLHLTWPLDVNNNILYKLGVKFVQTIHDPFPHLGQYGIKDEKDRLDAIRRADKIVLLSSPLLEKFCEYYHVNRNKILINKMGEFDHLNILHSGSSTNIVKPYILYVGQIQKHKGIDDLMSAMVKTHQKHPEIKLIVAGKGDFPFDMSPYIGLDYIEIRNHYIEVREMVELLVNCKFAVCPYKDATQSGVVQTAFSLGTPLIVTNVGDLPLSVQDGVTGKVVPPCDREALSNAINLLLENPNLLNKFKENIKTIWKKNQDWSPIAERYIDLYRKLVNNN